MRKIRFLLITDNRVGIDSFPNYSLNTEWFRNVYRIVNISKPNDLFISLSESNENLFSKERPMSSSGQLKAVDVDETYKM